MHYTCLIAIALPAGRLIALSLEWCQTAYNSNTVMMRHAVFGVHQRTMIRLFSFSHTVMGYAVFSARRQAAVAYLEGGSAIAPQSPLRLTRHGTELQRSVFLTSAVDNSSHMENTVWVRVMQCLHYYYQSTVEHGIGQGRIAAAN